MQFLAVDDANLRERVCLLALLLQATGYYNRKYFKHSIRAWKSPIILSCIGMPRIPCTKKIDLFCLLVVQKNNAFPGILYTIPWMHNFHISFHTFTFPWH